MVFSVYIEGPIVDSWFNVMITKINVGYRDNSNETFVVRFELSACLDKKLVIAMALLNVLSVEV